MLYKLLILVVIIGIGTSIYVITQYNKPMHIEIVDIVTNPEVYNGKEIIVNGTITSISNGKTIYTLWSDNRMIILDIPEELKKDLKINKDIEVEGIVKIEDKDIWIDVKRIEYR